MQELYLCVSGFVSFPMGGSSPETLSFPVLQGHEVYSILSHGRVTHRPGLYKAGVCLQGYVLISSIKCSFGCPTPPPLAQGLLLGVPAV
jgi:hypothetical protein